jgi:hypothetical protein
MNISKKAVITALLLVGILVAAQEKYTAQQVPNPQDGANAKLLHLKNLRGVRYMEIFLVSSEPVNGDLMGTCYNTTPYNRAGGSKDSAPAGAADKLNPVELAKQNDVKRVWLNPPRQWLLDNVDIEIGKVREFGGLEAGWVAIMAMPKGEWAPFTTTTIARKSMFSFNKGTTVYLVDDPQGTTYIMKSVSPSVDKANTYENISTVASRLKLPNGWKYRTAVLDKELVLIPTSGVATILKDNIDDVYDVTGPGYSTFKP